MNSFKSNNDEKWLDDLLGKSIGSEKVEPDFEKWRQNHPQAVEMLISQAKQKAPTSYSPLGIWSIIMKSRITKFAAAAVIIIAVVLSISLLNKLTPSAYALEQTLKAYEGIRFVHIKDFKDGESEPKEFWVELNEQEQVKRFRASLPAWAEREGPMLAVWNDGKLQIWGKKDNVLVTKHKESWGLEMLKFVKGFNPRFVVKELHQLETEGKVEIKTSEPELKSEPIVITAKFLPQSNDVGQMVLSVDQNTMLVTRAVINKPKDFDGYQHSLEFSDYNIAVDENFFTLSEVPENVAKYDLTKIGVAQGKLGDDEIAVELARQFIQSLIDKDYAKAGKLSGGLPAEKMQWLGKNISYKKIICIEQPTSRPTKNSNRALNVPCVFAAKYFNNPRVFVMRQNISVEAFLESESWIVNCPGIETPVITVDPTDTTTTFLKNINSKLASLDINKSTANDVIGVLGEPWAYRFEDKDLQKDNLPETYVMTYPGSFIVSIHKNRVMLWGSEQIPGYVFSDSIQIGATLNEVLKEIGSPAKIVEEIELPNHRTKNFLFEDNTIYENMNINQRKGFCFWTNRNGEKIRIYFDDNVLYRNMNKTKGNCFYGTVSKGKRIGIWFIDNKVFSLHEYRTKPIKNIE